MYSGINDVNIHKFMRIYENLNVKQIHIFIN